MDYRADIIESTNQLDNYFTKAAEQLGEYSEPLELIRKQMADTIEHVDSINQLFPLRVLLKEYTANLNAQLGKLTTHGDALDKPTAKAFAEKHGFSTWQQYKKQCTALVEQIIGSTNDETAIDCSIKNIRQTIKEARWLTEKFGDGKYTDVLGLCKAATREEIEGKNWSLTPGAYVGVAPAPNGDEENFAERMAEIHNELFSLQMEANALMNTITANFEGLGL